MIASADAVVIGSGAFGASAAYHLARRGVRVAVLERAGEVARGAAAGVAIDLVSVAEARRRRPLLGERGIVAVTWSPTDCRPATSS